MAHPPFHHSPEFALVEPPGFRLFRAGAPTFVAFSEAPNPGNPSTKGMRQAKRFRPAGLEPLELAGARRGE